MYPSADERLPVERAGHSADEVVVATRLAIDRAAAAGIWASDPPAVATMVGGVEALRVDPRGAPVATIVHFHGGAYRVGCPEQVAPFAAALAVRCGVTVICPRYRLAPEHPFPAAFNDGLAVLRALTDSGDRPIVSGDSAGGGLAASLTARRVADGAPPAGLVLLSPWLDLRAVSDGYSANAMTDPLFSREAALQAASLYLQGIEADHPYASPLLGTVSGFPPTLVNFGLGEVLADDSRAFSAALERAAIAVRCVGVPGMDHVAVTRGLTLPGASETFAVVADFVDGLVAARTGSAAAVPKGTLTSKQS